MTNCTSTQVCDPGNTVIGGGISNAAAPVVVVTPVVPGIPSVPIPPGTPPPIVTTNPPPPSWDPIGTYLLVTDSLVMLADDNTPIFK